MALYFPPNQPNGTEYEATNGVTYVYDSSKNVWVALAVAGGSEHPIFVSDVEPTGKEGYLWSDTNCPHELKVFTTCDDPSGQWEQISGGPSINIPDVDGNDISFNPSVPGTGTDSDPYLLSSAEVSWGEDTLSNEFIRITNQKPGSLIVIRDLNDSVNGERFLQPPAFADENGEWVGKLHFNDTPESHQDETYVGFLRIGANGVNMEWDVTAKAPGEIVTPHITSLNDTGSGTISHILTDPILTATSNKITVSGNTNLSKFEAGDHIYMTDGTVNPDGTYEASEYSPLTAQVQTISEGTDYTGGGATISTVGAVSQAVSNNGLGVLFDGEDSTYLSCNYVYNQNSSPCNVYTTINFPAALNLVSHKGDLEYYSSTSAIHQNTAPRVASNLTVTYSDGSTSAFTGATSLDANTNIMHCDVDAGKVMTKFSFSSPSLTASGKPWHRFFWIKIDGVRMVDEATILHFSDTTDVEYFIGGDLVEDKSNSSTATCVGSSKDDGEIIVRGGSWRAANGQTYGPNPGANVSTLGGPIKSGEATVDTVEADGFTITGTNFEWIGTNTAGTDFFVTGPEFFDAPLETADVKLESTPFKTDPERVDNLSSMIWEIHEDGGPVDEIDVGLTNPYHPKNLNTNSSYHVKVKHIGQKIGESDWSDSITFNTGNT